MANRPEKYAAPVEAESFKGLPEAYIEVCEKAPLRDEGLNYAEALRKTGNQVETHCVRGAFHNVDLKTDSDSMRGYMDKRVAALNRGFHGERS